MDKQSSIRRSSHSKEIRPNSDQIDDSKESLQNQTRMARQEPISWLPRVMRVKPSVYCVSCSPDGQYFVTGDYGGIWQRHTDKEACVGKFLLHRECAVREVHYSTNGQFLITQSVSFSDGCIAIKTWNSNNFRVIRNFYINKNKGVFTLILAKNDNFFAYTDSNGQIYLCSLKNCKQIRRIVGHQDNVEQIRFKSDSQFILSASWDKTISLWNISSAKQKSLYIDRTCVRFAQFSPDESKIATSNADDNIHIWDTSTGFQTQEEIRITKKIENLYYSPDGNALFVLYDEGIIVWSLQTNTKVGEIQNQSEYPFTNIQFSPNGEFMIVITINTVSILKVLDHQRENQSQRTLRSRRRSQIKNH